MVADRTKELRTCEGAALVQLEGGVIVAAWGPGSPLIRWNWWLAQLRSAIRATPGGIAVLSAIQLQSGPQDPEVRKQAKAELIKLAPSVRRFVIYPIGEGALAGLARTVIRTMFMLNPSTRQFTLAGSEAKAIEAVHNAHGPTREELADALRLVIGAIE